MKIDVKKIAALANLPLSTDELKKIGSQLEETLVHIESLREIDTKETEPTSQVTGLENILREDKVRPSLDQDNALSNSSSVQNGFFKTGIILKNE